MERSSSEPTNQPITESSVTDADLTGPMRPSASNTDLSAKDECYITLAQVNLLRIRKQTQSAIDLCESALKRWPSRAGVHALMGDLYHESNRIDDAILRYCRVLELDPKSRTNRKKLADMVRLKRQRLSPLPNAKTSKQGIRSDRLIRAIILGLATLMLITIMVTPMIFEHRQLRQSSIDSTTTIDRRINLNPIILQAAQPTATSTDQTGQASAAPTVIRDPVEQALVDLMSNDKSLLQLGIQVLDAQEDPLTNGFVITFLDRPAEGDIVSKAELLRNAVMVGQSASSRFGTRDVKQFTIRCLILSTSSQFDSSTPTTAISGTTALSFVGTIQRSDLPLEDADSTTFTEDQLTPLFTNVWWADGIE